LNELQGKVHRLKSRYALRNSLPEEGLNDIAFLFEQVAKIEKTHEERYLKLAANLKDCKVFSRETDEQWICENCGHIHYGKNAPEVCPVCGHPKAYFDIKAFNY
jgi:rubrerythrin